MATIREIITNRKNIDRDSFYVEPVCVSKLDGNEIIRRRQWYGVRKDGIAIVDPIFDDVTLYPHDIAILKIDGLCACFNMALNKLVLGFKYGKIDYEEGFLKLYRLSDKFGLFEIKRSKIISRCGKYEDYNLKNIATEYIWARRGKYFDYINRLTCNVVRLPLVTMAYDTTIGMFAKNEQDVVAAYNADGYADTLKLRQIAKQLGGYVTLDNFTYHIKHIIDINGNILNI